MQINTNQLGFNGYNEFLDDVNYPATFNLFSTGKAGKKTDTIGGIYPIMRILQDPKGNVIMTRKEQKQHRETTLNSIKFGIRTLSNAMDYDITPMFKIRETPNVFMERIDTNQGIYFLPFDIKDLNRTAIKPKNTNGFISDIIMDEVIEPSDGDQTIDEIKDHIKAFKTLCDTIFRYKFPKDMPPKITLLFNPWTGENWVNELFLRNNVFENMEILENEGRQYYYDPNFVVDGIDGKGLKIFIANRLINEFLSDENKTNALMMKYTNPNDYKTAVLGIRGRLSGGVYADITKYIEEVDEKWVNDNCTYFSFGLDYGTVEDTTALILNAFTHPTETKKATMVIAGGVGHSNSKDPIHLNDKEQMDKMIDGLLDLAKKYPALKNGVNVNIDGHAHTIAEIFMDRVKLRGIDWVSTTLSSKPQTPLRVQTERQLITEKRVFRVVDNATSQLIWEMNKMRYGENGKRVDKQDHFINAWEYGWIDLNIV